MIRAIMSGAKTMTRRVIKPQPSINGTIDCPYGVPTTHLWVRETFCRCGCDTDCGHVGCYTIYKSDEKAAIGAYGCVKWKPSIFMPRWASRITLEIESVWVERLMDISEDDARAEGVDLNGFKSRTEGISGREHRIAFSGLWDSINGKTYPWSTNCWVWKIQFHKL